jgi:outer membrane protein TolC
MPLRTLTFCAAGVMLAAVAAAQTPPAFPITFHDAVRHAADHYPAIVAANARLSAQRSGIDLARTAYLPRLDSSLQINRATRNNVAGLLLPGTTIPGISGPVSDEASGTTIWGSGAAMLLSWEAFDFGARAASVGVAESQAARASAAAALTRLEVGVRTADAFLRLAAAQETVRAARANVTRQEVFAGAVGTLVKNELRPGADDSRAQAELALARIQLIQSEQAEQVARAGLAQWLGVEPAAVQIASEGVLQAPPPMESVPASAVSHPLAQTQQAAIDFSKALQRVFDRSFYPRFNVQTAYSARGTGVNAAGLSTGGGLGLDTSNFAFGVTATWPVFDWFSLRERKRIEAHNERAETAGYDRVVRELSAQAQQAHAEVEGARRIAENTPIQLSAARVLEQQSRARYDAGLATIVEVADAQRLLLQSEVGDAVARLGVWRAWLSEVAARGDVARLLQ